MDLHLLSELGLSDGQIRVYNALLELGNANLNAIQQKTGIERRGIYDIINKLIDKGLVSYTIEQGKRSLQLTNTNNLAEAIQKKQASLQELSAKIPEITAIMQQTKIDTNAQVYRGNEAIKSLLNEVLQCRESFWMGGNSFEEYKAVPKGLQLWFERWMKQRAQKKHIMHDLVSHGTYLKGFEPKKKTFHKRQFYRYHQLPKGLYVPMVIIIFGDKVAQIQWGNQSFAFVLESEKIRDSFKKYFDHFWNAK